jgi:hypothetical protein
MTTMSREDVVLDRLWRAQFGAPLPMYGAGPQIKRLLQANGLRTRQIEESIRMEPRTWI